MTRYLEPAKEIEVFGEYDVVIVGGGPAGLAAAIASGRNQANTLLIERFGYLGGTATASLMININGFRNQVEPDSVQTIKGIAQEIILELHRLNGLGKSPYEQKEYEIEQGELSYSYCVDPEKFKFEHFQEILEQNPQLKEAGAYLAETPPLLGIRQTRFIEGEYRLTAEDAIEGRRFDKVIAISSCPIIHYYGYRRYLEHEGYDIPYRCLVPKLVDNLLIAGRCISSEQQPYESHRSMAPIMAIGQAAGTAAALCAKGKVKPRDLDVSLLQQRLIEQGAELRR